MSTFASSLSRLAEPSRQFAVVLEHAVDAESHAECAFARFQVNVRRLHFQRLLDKRIHQVDDGLRFPTVALDAPGFWCLGNAYAVRAPACRLLYHLADFLFAVLLGYNPAPRFYADALERKFIVYVWNRHAIYACLA